MNFYINVVFSSALNVTILFLHALLAPIQMKPNLIAGSQMSIKFVCIDANMKIQSIMDNSDVLKSCQNSTFSRAENQELVICLKGIKIFFIKESDTQFVIVSCPPVLTDP